MELQEAEEDHRVEVEADHLAGADPEDAVAPVAVVVAVVVAAVVLAAAEEALVLEQEYLSNHIKDLRVFTF